eukprot:scaffold3226_cov251-Pinguiococcus_pyrenoidosus.AAC.12
MVNYSFDLRKERRPVCHSLPGADLGKATVASYLVGVCLVCIHVQDHGPKLYIRRDSSFPNVAEDPLEALLVLRSRKSFRRSCQDDSVRDHALRIHLVQHPQDAGTGVLRLRHQAHEELEGVQIRLNAIAAHVLKEHLSSVLPTTRPGYPRLSTPHDADALTNASSSGSTLSLRPLPRIPSAQLYVYEFRGRFDLRILSMIDTACPSAPRGLATRPAPAFPFAGVQAAAPYAPAFSCPQSGSRRTLKA